MSGCPNQFCDLSPGEHLKRCNRCGHPLHDHAHGRHRPFWFCENPECFEDCDHFESEED